jgi:CheY-like chemotaxis protein
VQNNGVGRLRVLVADDSEPIRRAIVRLLQDTFEIVGVVSSGCELVEAAHLLQPDVILSDLAMPSLTGAGALRILRDAGSAIPFVLMTATVRNPAKLLELGALCVVDKCDLHLDLVPAVLSAAAGETYISRRARCCSGD